MEIQAQMPMTTALAGAAGATAAGGGANASSGQASGGGNFSATLVGLLSAAPVNEAAAQQAAVMPGLSGLIQMLGNTGQAQSQAPADEAAFKQLIDALLAMLNSDSEDAKALLDNSEFQAMLAELQAILLAQAAAQTGTELSESGSSPNEAEAVETANRPGAIQIADDEGKPVALNAALFVPLEQDGTTEQTVPVEAEQPSLKPAVSQEVQQVLQQLKQLLQAERNATPAVLLEQQAAAGQSAPVEAEQPLMHAATRQEAQQILQQLKQLLHSEQNEASVAKGGKHLSVQSVQTEMKPLLAQQATVLQTAEASASSQSSAPVVTTVNPKLEYLAAKSISFRMDTPIDSQNGPLFEPLAEIVDHQSDSQPIPLSEYLKQAPNGTNPVKAPIIMHAPTFAEDMTQLVMKSFSLNAMADGVTEAKLSLYPQHLGHVEIKLTMHNGQLIAQFMADSITGKEMLESQLSQLRTTLQSQGIQVDKLEVSQNQAFQSGLFQEQRQQQFQQSGKQSKGNNNGGNQLTIEDEMKEAAASNVRPSLGQSSIDITA